MSNDLLVMLRNGCQELDLEATENQLEMLLLYKDLLIKWNKVFSLTAITNSREIIIQHLLDGLAAAKEFSGYTKILDVGSGMGVPAIILAIIYPNAIIVALDSNNKKTSFLMQVKIELKLKNLQIVNSRVEEYNDGDFAVITSRAFANMSLFVQLTEHLLAGNGIYLAMKSEQGINELTTLTDWSSQVIELDVPNLNAKRFLIKLSHK